MWTALLALFPTIAGWINLVIGWFQKRAADQTAADGLEQTAETQHQNDGAQSVEDKISADAQNEALDQLEQGLKDPTPIVVTLPVGANPHFRK